jgi:hypothetical protein
LLKWLLAIAFVTAVGILFLRLIPERWKLGEETGNFFSTLALAYVTGFTTSFLWHHLRRTLDNNRNRQLRLSIIEGMAAGHNLLLKAMIEDMTGIGPYEPPDYTEAQFDGRVDLMAREGWERQNQGISDNARATHMDLLRNGAISFIREQLEDIEPLLAQCHPTFLHALNRIRRELDVRTRVLGTPDDPDANHALDPLMQFSSIRTHIQWLRDVHRQIDDGADFTLMGAVPRFTEEELRARGVPEELLRMMRGGQ